MSNFFPKQLIEDEERIYKRMKPPKLVRHAPGPVKYDEGSDLFMNYWHSGDLLRVCHSVSHNGDENWSTVSESMGNTWDPNRPIDWYSARKCAMMYERFLSKFRTRKESFFEFRNAGSAEELMLQHLGNMRLFNVQGDLDAQRIICCKLTSVVEMINSGIFDHELDSLYENLENYDEMFERQYIGWLRSREPSPQKRTSKSSPTKGKASSPRSEESVKPVSVTSENSEIAGSRNTITNSSTQSETTTAQATSRTISIPFFNPTSALASAAARQLAAATATLPRGHHLARRESLDKSITPTTTVAVSVSSVTLSAPTLSKLLEMPPSMPGKLPPLPTAFYSSDFLALSSGSNASQSPDSSNIFSRKTTVNDQRDTNKSNKENNFTSRSSTVSTETEIIDITSPEHKKDGTKKEASCASQKDPSAISVSDKGLQHKIHTPVKQTVNDRTQGSIKKIGSSIAGSADSKNKKSESPKSDKNSKDSSNEIYICSTSESDDDISEICVVKPGTGIKDIPTSGTIPTNQLQRKRSRKQEYTERPGGSLDIYDSPEDSECTTHVPEKLFITNMYESGEFPITGPLAISSETDKRQPSEGGSSDSSKTLTFDACNVNQSSSKEINFLNKLDSVESKKETSPLSFSYVSLPSDAVIPTVPDIGVPKSGTKFLTLEQANLNKSSNLVGSVPHRAESDFSKSSGTGSSALKSVQVISKFSTNLLVSKNKYSDSQSAIPVVENPPTSEKISSCTVTEAGTSTEKISARIPDFTSNVHNVVDTSLQTRPLERIPPLKSKLISSSEDPNLRGEISNIMNEDVGTISVNKRKISESPDRQKVFEIDEGSSVPTKEKESNNPVQSILNKDTDSSKTPQRKLLTLPRRGRRGGRTLFSRRYFQASPSSDHSASDLSKDTKSGNSEAENERQLDNENIHSRIIDSDEDTIPDRVNIQPSKTRGLSRNPGRYGKRGRRGRGRGKKLISCSDRPRQDKAKGKEDLNFRVAPEVLEQDEETRTEIEENEHDSLKKESDSTTIEDSGASSQNSEKDFFTSNDNTEKNFADHEGESDIEGNDSHERKVPSESTDEADDSLMKSLADEKAIDMNDYSSTSPASTLTSEYLFSKCRDDKDDLYSRQWSPQSSAPTSQSAVTPTTSDSSDETENSDSEETDQTAHSNENSNSATKRKRVRKDGDHHQYKTWKKAISIVWREASYHKYANVFSQRVTDDVAPGYQSIVNRPMDLSLIKKNIDNGTIKTTQEFQRDVMLMFQNAIMYNSSDHDVYHMAVEMQRDVNKQIQDFLATQLIIQDKVKEASISTYLRTARNMKSQGKIQRSVNPKGQ